MANYDKNIHLLIERYLADDLHGDELLEFEVKISLDEELQKEIEFQKLLNNAIRYGRILNLRQFLQAKTTATRISGNIWGKTWTRVSIAIFIIAGIFFILTKTNTDVFELPEDIIKVSEPSVIRPAVPEEIHLDTLQTDTFPDVEVLPQSQPVKPKKAVLPKIENDKIIEVDIVEPDEKLQIQENLNIKKEIMVSEKTINAFQTDSALFFGKLSKRQAKKITKETETAGSIEYKVQVWESPINYKGYKLENQTLTVYGISSEEMDLHLVNNQLYLKIDNQIYPLKEQKTFTTFKAINSGDR
jgi:hypothetical protein